MSLSTMNWKRGLLRLWAVAAVLWIGLAFYSNDTVQRVRDAYALEKTLLAVMAEFKVISRPGAGSFRVVSRPDPSAPRLMEQRAQNTEAQRQPRDLLARQSAPRAQNTEAPYGIWPPLFDFAKLAFIPPLLLLALGYIGLWVGRGFRRQG